MKYPFYVFQTEVEGHVFWIAKSSSLKGCVGQGDTQNEAIEELQENEMAWLETAREAGIAIPEEQIEHVSDYSGKMTLRISPTVHQKAAQMARYEGISLNQYINNAIVAQNATLSVLH